MMRIEEYLLEAHRESLMASQTPAKSQGISDSDLDVIRAIMNGELGTPHQRGAITRILNTSRPPISIKTLEQRLLAIAGQRR